MRLKGVGQQRASALSAAAGRAAKWLLGPIEGRLPDVAVAVRRHRQVHGELPRILAPRTFSEKVLHRKLFDRRELLTRLADKYAVRTYVEARLGKDVLVALYGVFTDPTSIPFDELPPAFVVKPTHGSGWIRIVRDQTKLDRAALIAECRAWLAQSYYARTREWVYKNVQPRVLVEELIDDGSGGPPIDYKVFVFDGTARVIQVDVGRYADHRRDLFTVDWKRLDVAYAHENVGAVVPPPPHLTELVRAAERLGQGLDFVRADFYDTPQGIRFGELTTTPEGGLGWFRPRTFDQQLGAYWRLPRR